MVPLNPPPTITTLNLGMLKWLSASGPWNVFQRDADVAVGISFEDGKLLEQVNHINDIKSI